MKTPKTTKPSELTCKHPGHYHPQQYDVGMQPQPWRRARPFLRLTTRSSGVLLLCLLGFILPASAQVFTRITNELNFAQSDAGAIVWFDYDNTGWPDVLCNGGWKGGYGIRLFHNNRDGTFTQMEEAKFAGKGTPTFWSTVADFNDDGFLDVIAGSGSEAVSANPVLYLNQGGTRFTKIKLDPSAILGGTDVRGWGVAALDFDGDGLVDLGLARNDTARRNCLLKNTGAGVFSAITNTAWTLQGLSDPVSSVDYDGDGVPDLLGLGVSRPFLFRNAGAGDFTQVTNSLLSTSQSATSLNSSWGDFDNDGDLDVAITYVMEASKDLQVFLNDGNGNFTLGFSAAAACQNVYCADYDNDGRLDIYATGFNSRSHLYRNLGGGAFTEVLNEPPVQDSFGQWPTAAWGDYNNDGFMDLLVGATGSVNALYRNSTNGNHWLKVRLTGQASNRAAIGAVVRVNATIGGQDVWQMRVVQAQSGLADLVTHFGLGDATNVTTLRIEWPSGNVEEFVNLARDQVRNITELVRITPARPTASLGGSVKLTSLSVGTAYQWRFKGLDLAGQTNRVLNLTNLIASQEGRYSVVVSNASTLTTNYVYLRMDTTFAKITEGPVVTDLGISPVAPAWGDLNNDGYMDLMIVDEGRWVSASDFQRGIQMVYLNNRDGTFRRATEADIGPLANTALFATPMSLADYDNDGYLDVYMYEGVDRTPEKVAYLYRGGPDGKFTLVNQDAGINRPLSSWLPVGYYVGPWGVSWVDYDRDGLLDIYLTTGWTSLNTVDQLWRNNGNGTFSRVLTKVFKDVFDSNYGSWADYDNDGDPDLFVGGLNNTGRFYRNDGNGQFTNLSTSLGLTWSWYGAWGDYDNDGRLDLHTGNGLFWNDGTGHFVGKTGSAYPGNGAATWIDYDNDGYLDYFSPYYTPTSSRCLMRNNRDGTFTKVSLGNLTEDAATYGMAVWADYDNDGCLDVVFANRASNTVNNLYHNNGNGNHWILVKLVGTTSNRSAIGAKVRAQASIWGKSVQQLREISGTPFTGDLRAHFGLGDATNVTTLRIEWPSGTVQEIANVAANQILTVVEPRRPVLAVTVTPTVLTGTLAGDTNQVYQVHASDDFASGWTVLTNVTTDASGKGHWSDSATASQSRRFYKALKTP